ncbi:glycosyltransferase family 39 protein [Streptomyces boncukensis]|uniref:Glycosyltransferase n=1 Tax=Streptomyces boncukensis TaxID=2711219 RepID=A0A6G4WPP1_9ACTN|nr:glycosyltransferase family 39 protein [Streptomyces boncukensis]NGO67058.1 glycosyltransferase [Streptomyces boncukensis]
MPPPSAEPPASAPPAARVPRLTLSGIRSAGARPEPAADRRSYWLLLVPVLLAVTVCTRLPSFARPLWNPDEGFLATQARQLADGGTLYHDVVDRKPPLMPWLYQGLFALFGDGSLWPARVAAIGAVLVGGVFAASLARRRWGDRAGWTAGVVYVLLTIGLNPEDTQAATFEVFMLPWTMAAMWLADRRRWWWAGIAIAGAALTKQTGGAVLLPALFLLWRTRAGLLPALRLVAGTALPLAAAALAFGPGRFLYWIATGSGAYVSADGAGMHAAGRALGSLSILVAASAPLLVALGQVLRVRRLRERLTGVSDLWVWLAASAVAVAVGFQFYGHYFLQLTPPLALLAAAALRELTARQATVSLAVTSVFACAFVGWGYAYKRGELDHAQKLVAAVRERTAPDERILLWGMHPEGYWFAARPPASRYLTAGFLSNFSGGRGGIRTGERYAMDGSWPHFMRELREDPPTLIVDDSRGAPYRIPRMPTLRAYVDRHYERTVTVGGAVFYVRNTP